MKKLIILLHLILFTLNLFGVDITSMHNIYEGKLIVYSEDDNDYSHFIGHMISSLENLEHIFNKRLSRIPIVYIFTDHISSSKKIFNSDVDVIQTAMADPINARVWLTSPFDHFKTKECYYSVPVHEFVHLLYSPSELWFREGLAVYFSNQLMDTVDADHINKYVDLYPKRIIDYEFVKYYNNFGLLVKYIYECKLEQSIENLIEFSESDNKAQFLGYNNMDQLIMEWKNWIKEES